MDMDSPSAGPIPSLVPETSCLSFCLVDHLVFLRGRFSFSICSCLCDVCAFVQHSSPWTLSFLSALPVQNPFPHFE
ncbi:rCG28376 [Rattus norvegicus]|uniref:RCG28376 n=1 Tax=Rattus norvegicus TaxID=10116 RepID=A6KTY8_RAT|nr:rCG28376 [Rattus norvegicus]